MNECMQIQIDINADLISSSLFPGQICLSTAQISESEGNSQMSWWAMITPAILAQIHCKPCKAHFGKAAIPWFHPEWTSNTPNLHTAEGVFWSIIRGSDAFGCGGVKCRKAAWVMTKKIIHNYILVCLAKDSAVMTVVTRQHILKLTELFHLLLLRLWTCHPVNLFPDPLRTLRMTKWWLEYLETARELHFDARITFYTYTPISHSLTLREREIQPKIFNM